MRRRAFLSGLAAVPLAAQPAAEDVKRWDDLYAQADPVYNPYPNRFLASVAANLKPGRALDVGMGQGRNSLFLAALGWQVTGVDVSAKGIELAKERASRRKLTLQTVVADFDSFDAGKAQWDLVVGMYMHDLLTSNAAKLAESLRPGGRLVVEGFHRDIGVKGIVGGPLGHLPNDLLKVFTPLLRILHYEEVVDFGDWTRSMMKVPLVRMVAMRSASAP